MWPDPGRVEAVSLYRYEYKQLMADPEPKRLGAFLKNRRGRIDPTSLGLVRGRRRTPGLRREEVAQRAHVSVTWYTWLEQGRGGAPSADVLDRLSRALALSGDEREHLFLLAQHRPPEPQGDDAVGDVPPQLQRLLDSLDASPAYVRNPGWNVVAWNAAAAAVLTDYAARPPEERNILRLLFTDLAIRAALPEWEDVAREVVAAFRADSARAGTCNGVTALIDELGRTSPEFAAIWADGAVRTHGAGRKRMMHAEAGALALDYTSLMVAGRPDLGLVIFTPATPDDAERVRALIRARS